MPRSVPSIKGMKTGTFAWLFVAICSLYVLSASPMYYPGDDVYYLNLARALVDRHSVALNPPSGHAFDSTMELAGPDGRTFAMFTLGHPLVLAVPYAAWRCIAPFLSQDLSDLALKLLLTLVPTTMLAGAILLCAWRAARWGYSPTTVVVWALGMACGTMLWPGSKALLSEPSQAFFLTLVAIGATIQLEAPTAGGALALGLATGFLVHVKISHVMVIPVAGLVVAYPRGASGGRQRAWRLALFAAPVVIALVLMGEYNVVRAGTAFTHGYGGQPAILGLCTPVWSGLYGLFLSSGKGLVFYSPFLILGVAGMRPLVERQTRAALAILGLIVPHVILRAVYFFWSGDWAWGPRFLVPVLPLLGLFALPAVDALRSTRRGTTALAGLIGLGAAVQLLGVLVDPFFYIDLVRRHIPLMPGKDILASTPPHDPFIVDLLLFNHHIPAFSPLAAHAWLLRRIALGASPGDYPWSYLGIGPLAPPLTAVPSIDLWWTALAPGAQGFAGMIVAGSLAVVLGLALLRLSRVCASVSGAMMSQDAASVEGGGRPEVSIEAADAAPEGPRIETVAGSSGASNAVPRMLAPLLWVALLGLTLPRVVPGSPTATHLWPAAGLAAAALTAWLIARVSDRLGLDSARAVGLLAIPSTLLWSRARDGPLAFLALASALIVERAVPADRARRTPGRWLLAALAMSVVAIVVALPRIPTHQCPPFLMGLLGVTISPGKGLWIYAPILCFIGSGLRRWPREGAWLAVLGAIPLLIEAWTGAWVDDARWGAAGTLAALPPLLVLAAPAFHRPRATVWLVAFFGLAIGVASVAVSPDAYLSVLRDVPGLVPPGHPGLRPLLADPLLGVEFVPDLSPVAGQVWMVWLAVTHRAPRDSNPPYGGLFWRGFSPRAGTPPPLDLALVGPR